MSDATVNGAAPAVKCCTKCGTSQLVEQFPKDSSKPNGRHTWCRACKDAASRRWAERNPEKTRKASRECADRRRKREPETVREYQREWAEKNPDKARAKTARWKKAHPAKNTESVARRKAKQLGALVGEIGPILAFYRLIRTADRVRCHWCNLVVPKASRHVDHIVPLDKQGAHAVWNLCCACSTCNTKKSSKSPEQFAGQAFLPFLKTPGTRHDGNLPTPST